MKRLLTGAAVLAALGFTMYVSDQRIETRVDVRIRGTVAAIVDSLEREGVAAEPLIQYALQGTMRGGSPEKILLGVKKWARDLRRSRELLGPNASPAEVEAGAKAIKAGADEQQLLRFRESKSSQRFANASALSTIAYLIPKGVPADTATTVLVNVALNSASIAEIQSLQDDIERDIGGGTPPGSATVGRAVGLLAAMTAESDSANSVVPGAALPSTRGTARPADPMANGSPRGSAVGSQGTGARPPAPRGKDSKRPPP
jgi:hypothetical protein